MRSRVRLPDVRMFAPEICSAKKEKMRKNKSKNTIHDPVRIKGANCAFCSKRLDATTGLDASRPKTGDLSVCFYCGQLMVFCEGDALRAATSAETEDFALDRPREYALSKKLRRIYRAKRSALEN